MITIELEYEHLDYFEMKRDSTHNNTWYIQDRVKEKERNMSIQAHVLQLHADVEVIQCNRECS